MPTQVKKCAEARCGHAGSQVGDTSSSCFTRCEQGHYCPEGSVCRYVISNRPNENDNWISPGPTYECGGPQYYCPEGTGILPLEVGVGYYSIYQESWGTPSNAVARAICEERTFCEGGIKNDSYAGHYVTDEGATRNIMLANVCQKGYFCPVGSKRATETSCAVEGALDAAKSYCPAGTDTVLTVPVGEYSLPLLYMEEDEITPQLDQDGNTIPYPTHLRYDKAACPADSACPDGGLALPVVEYAQCETLYVQEGELSSLHLKQFAAVLHPYASTFTVNFTLVSVDWWGDNALTAADELCTAVKACAPTDVNCGNQAGQFFLNSTGGLEFDSVEYPTWLNFDFCDSAESTTYKVW